MKAMLLTLLIFLPTVSPARTCRETIRDASGRLVRTIESRKSADGTVHTVIRDAAGRLVSTATTRTALLSGCACNVMPSQG